MQPGITCNDSEIGKRIAHPRDAMRLMLPLMLTERETLVVTCLDADRRVMTAYVAATGTRNEVQCDPRAIFAPALVMGAAFILVAHNHPSGDPTPSNADLQTTKIMEACAQILGIGFVDHLVLTAAGRFTSIAEYMESYGR